MTQNDRLLDYLKEHRTITPLESWTELGIYRLGARVFDLKRMGYDIRSGRTMVRNRFGEECFVAKYSYHPPFQLEQEQA